MLYYKLENLNEGDIFFAKIFNELKHSLSKCESFENKILVIKIQDVASDDNTMIPKLEVKNS